MHPLSLTAWTFAGIYLVTIFVELMKGLPG